MTPVIMIATSVDYLDLGDDGGLLPAALREVGVDARVARWDDPTVGWAGADLVLIRSTWDYTRRFTEFRTWLSGCGRTANPADVVRWNMDKHYLADLAGAGVPVVPTTFLEPGDALRPGEVGPGQVVVKPAVSAGAADTGRFEPDDPRAASLVAELHDQGRCVLLQPYLSQVATRGETTLIFLGGTVSHVVRKPALLRGTGLDDVLRGDAARLVITPSQATAAEFAVATSALAAVPMQSQLTYARVDLVPGEDGRPLLLELELVEPDLFLRLAPEPGVAAARLAEAAVEAAAA